MAAAGPHARAGSLAAAWLGFTLLVFQSSAGGGRVRRGGQGRFSAGRPANKANKLFAGQVRQALAVLCAATQGCKVLTPNKECPARTRDGLRAELAAEGGALHAGKVALQQGKGRTPGSDHGEEVLRWSWQRSLAAATAAAQHSSSSSGRRGSRSSR